MRKFADHYWQPALTWLFGLAVFLFWRLGYPFALAYQEQFQLFLFDRAYFAERVAVPGGLACWVAEFLVQFYNSVTLGAAILALLLMLLQWLTWRLMLAYGRQDSGSRCHYPLSFLPPVLLWYLMSDESVMLTYVVALLMVVLSMLAYRGRWPVRLAFAVVVIPLLYWLAGPVVLALAVWIGLREVADGSSWLAGLGAGIVAVGYAVVCILASAHVLPFPLDRLMVGLSYYRFPAVLLAMMVVTPLSVVVLPFVSRCWQAGRRAAWLQAAVVLLLGVLLVPRGFDAKKYELIEYDYLVRIKDWNGIIGKATRQQPDLPMSVSATNLALAMTGQLGDRAFDFYQRGVQGLVPRFERNFTTAQLTGEIYFNLGLVNTAQRFAFESMECLPNYNKSGRVVKRLAETSLVNGQYEVARKYLHMLQKTIFYRRWAQRTLALVGNEQQIEAHPLYGWLRKARLTDDFLFSEQEIDKACGQLFVHCPDNKMAMQYLLMIPLLNRNLANFMQYLPVVQNQVAYNPRTCQEAVVYAFAQQNQRPPTGVVSEMVRRNFVDFAHTYNRAGKDSPELERFRGTVWYYLVGGQ